jgi:hypothetical protein
MYYADMEYVGALECWSAGALEYWSAGVLECWSDGAPEWWSIGVVEWWSGGFKSVNRSDFYSFTFGYARSKHGLYMSIISTIHHTITLSEPEAITLYEPEAKTPVLHYSDYSFRHRSLTVTWPCFRPAG